MKSVLLTTPEVQQLARDGSVEVRRAVKRTSDQFWEHPGWTPTIEGPYIVWRSPGIETIYTFPLRSPFGSPGEERWVRETWGEGFTYAGEDAAIFYRADGQCRYLEAPAVVADSTAPKDMRWRSATQLPRWASRYTVTCSALRVEKNNNVWEWVATLTREQGK